MSKLLTRFAALAVGLLLPAMTLATSYDYNDYNYDYNAYDDSYSYNDYYNSYDYDYDSGASAALGIGVLVFLGFALLVAAVFFAFEIWMIVDCIKRDFENRTLWLVLLIAGIFFGFGWIVAIIYYFVVKHKNVGKVHSASTGTTPPPTTPSQPAQ